jgi:hypothetical protein
MYEDIKWNKCSRRCPLCNNEAETTEHLFFSCEGPIKRWEKLLQVLEQTDFNINDCTSLFEIIGLAIDKSKRSPTLLIIVAETLLACWKDRVKWSF